MSDGHSDFGFWNKTQYKRKDRSEPGDRTTIVQTPGPVVTSAVMPMPENPITPASTPCFDPTFQDPHLTYKKSLSPDEEREALRLRQYYSVRDEALLLFLRTAGSDPSPVQKDALRGTLLDMINCAITAVITLDEKSVQPTP